MPNILPIAAFSDNYIWLIIGPQGQASVVDPGDATPVLEHLSQQRLTLKNILITHKHNDHTGGCKRLLGAFPDVRVYGPGNESIAALTHTVGEGDRLTIPGIDGGLTVMEVPGHTEGHLAYYGDGALFCGDALFLGGCGRIFSGTHQQMADSLRRLASLPPATQVYCAHEYTLANLGFAKWVEPDNPDILGRFSNIQSQRAHNRPSVPAPLSEEFATNPFLRTQQPQVIAAAARWANRELKDHRETFRALREWKDQDYD
jgi:hydroxyacylglutathione hydrolase